MPYEVIKQKLQTGEYTSTLQALKHMNMAENGGMRAFFPSMGDVAIQMYRDIPYAIVTMLTYECLRDHWVSQGREKSVGVGNAKGRTAPWRDMVVGGLAGGIGSFAATNPMDVIKTRLQCSASII